MNDVQFKRALALVRMDRKIDTSGGPDACWPWTACRDANGYGRMWNGQATVYVHRTAWERVNGRIPEGMHVCHSCDNPSCANPTHLFLGTNTENIADRVQKGRSADQWGAKHPKTRLTSDQVLEIRTKHAQQSSTVREMAERFGVSLKCIHGIVYRHNWRMGPFPTEEVRL